jgi:hypothetical protein
VVKAVAELKEEKTVVKNVKKEQIIVKAESKDRKKAVVMELDEYDEFQIGGIIFTVYMYVFIVCVYMHICV